MTDPKKPGKPVVIRPAPAIETREGFEQFKLTDEFAQLVKKNPKLADMTYEDFRKAFRKVFGDK